MTSTEKTKNKIELLLFARASATDRIPVGGKKLISASSKKHLGIWIDSNLTFRPDKNHVCQKHAHSTGVVSEVLQYFSESNLNITMFEPNVQRMPIAHGNTAKKLLKRIASMQKSIQLRSVMWEKIVLYQLR